MDVRILIARVGCLSVYSAIEKQRNEEDHHHYHIEASIDNGHAVFIAVIQLYVGVHMR